MVNHQFLVNKIVLKSPLGNKVFYEENFSPSVIFDFTPPEAKNEDCGRGGVMETLNWRDSYLVKF